MKAYGVVDVCVVRPSNRWLFPAGEENLFVVVSRLTVGSCHLSYQWVRSIHLTRGSLPSLLPVGPFHPSYPWVPAISLTSGSVPSILPLGPCHPSYQWVPVIHHTRGSLPSILPVGPCYPSYQWVPTIPFTGGSLQSLLPMGPGSILPGVKLPGCEPDHSPPSSAVVKNAWNYISIPTRLHVVMFN
jgi:hypothetical protein